MGSTKTDGGATAARSASSGAATTKARPRPGDWMAKRQTPNRGAAFGRGFLAGAMLVGAYGALYLVQSNNLPPEPPDKWGQWIRDYVMPILPVAIVTILIATFGGVLIELLIPPLRAPAHDVSRWLVVFILGLTLGPVSFLVAYDFSDLDTAIGPANLGYVVALSALAFLAAELWMGRGRSSTSSR